MEFLKRHKWKTLVVFFALIATVAYAAGFERIPKDLIIQGTGTSASKVFEWDVGLGAANPKLRANSTSPFLEFAGDGVSFLPFGSGSGGASGINVLTNGDFELGTANNWTASGTSVLADEESGDLLNGAKSASWDAGATAETLTSDAGALPLVVDGKVCLASFFYKDGDANIVAEVVDGSANVLAQQVLRTVTEATPVVMPFLCPTSDTVSWRLRATADAAEIFVDDVFAGTRSYTKPSLELVSVDDPNATLSGGGLYLANGRVLKTYDGSGTTSADYGEKLTVSLDTILGASPADATAYWLCVDQDSLGSATTLTDTGEKVTALTESELVLLTDAPEDILQTRYECLARITSAASGTVWSGSGASFGDLPSKRLSGPPIAVNPIIFSQSQTVGSVGSVANAQGELTTGDFPNTTTLYLWNLQGDALGDFGGIDLTEVDAPDYDGKGFFGREDMLNLNGTSEGLTSTDAIFDAGTSAFSTGIWIEKTDWTVSGSLFSNWDADGNERVWLFRINGANLECFTSSNGTGNLSHSIGTEAITGAHHLGLVYDGSGVATCYFDGQPFATLAQTLHDSAAVEFAIGTHDAGNFSSLVAQDFFFHSGTALTPTQMNAIYSKRFTNNQQIAGGHELNANSFPLSDLTGKTSFYRLDTDDGATLLDDSVNSIALTVEGTPDYVALGLFGATDAVRLDGATDAFTVVNSFFTPDNGYSFGGWFALDFWNNPAANNHLLEIGTSSGGNRKIALKINSGGTLSLQTDVTGDGLFDFTDTVTAATNLVDGSWHHVALVNLKSDGKVKVYIDGQLSNVLDRDVSIAGDSRFRLGAAGGASVSEPMAGRISNFFFSQDKYSDEDIRKLARSRLDLSRSTPINSQEWLGLYTREDSQIENEFDKGWILDKSETALYLDPALNSGDVIEMKLRDTGFSPSVVSVQKFNMTYTSDPCAGAECAINHLLPGRPANVEVWHEVNVGEWERQDPSTCQATTTTLVCLFTGITTIDATHKLNVVASMSDLAGAFEGDPVTNGAQTWTGVKTVSDGIVPGTGSDTLLRFIDWTDVVYNAGDFTANSGSWSVDPGDVAEFKYMVVGNAMTVSFRINSTDISATPVDLRLAIPSGFTMTGEHTVGGFLVDAGTDAAARISARSGTGQFINVSFADGSSYTTTASDNTTVRGQIVFEITP